MIGKILLILTACAAVLAGCEAGGGSDGTGFYTFQYVNGVADINDVNGYVPAVGAATYACAKAADNVTFNITVTAEPRGITNNFAKSVTLEVETAEFSLEPLQGGGIPLSFSIGNSVVPLAIVPYDNSRSFALVFSPSAISFFQNMASDAAFEYGVKIKLRTVERINSIASGNITGNIDLSWDRLAIAGSSFTCPPAQ